MIKSEKKFFKLFANCIPVKGAARSIICDLQRNEYEFIPNSMCELLMEYKNISIDVIKAEFGEENEAIIDEYFQFLVEKELGFWCENPAEFPELNTQWDFPAWITNAIMDIDKQSDYNYKKVFTELNDLGCKAVQIRCYDAISFDKLKSILDQTQNRRLQSVELFIKYDDTIEKSQLLQLFNDYLRVSALYVHTSPFSEQIDIPESYSRLIYLQQQIDSHTHCGMVHPAYFNVVQENFMEALLYNSCLNRKISVDVNGDIKNCPSLLQSYGNIATTSLHSALAEQSFKDLWQINKDQINTCKDCEFRYICTDCRAFIQQPDAKYSKPAKCTYDPYTNVWE